MNTSTETGSYLAVTLIAVLVAYLVMNQLSFEFSDFVYNTARTIAGK